MANDFQTGNIFTFIDLRYENMLQSFGLLRMNLIGNFLYKRLSFYGVKHLAWVLTADVHPDLGALVYVEPITGEVHRLTDTVVLRGASSLIIRLIQICRCGTARY